MGLKQRRSKYIDYGRPLTRDSSSAKAAADEKALGYKIDADRIRDVGKSIQQGYSIHAQAQRRQELRGSKVPDYYQDIERNIDQEYENVPLKERIKKASHRQFWETRKVSSINEKYGTNISQSEWGKILNYAKKKKQFYTSDDIADKEFKNLLKTPTSVGFNTKTGGFNLESLSTRFKDATGRELDQFFPKTALPNLESTYRFNMLSQGIENGIKGGGISFRAANKGIKAELAAGTITKDQANTLSNMSNEAYIHRSNLLESMKETADERRRLAVSKTEAELDNKTVNFLNQTVKQASTAEGHKKLSMAVASKFAGTVSGKAVRGEMSISEAGRELHAILTKSRLSETDQAKARAKYSKQAELINLSIFGPNEKTYFMGGVIPKVPMGTQGLREFASSLYRDMVKHNTEFAGVPYNLREGRLREHMQNMGLEISKNNSTMKFLRTLPEILNEAGIPFGEFTRALAEGDKTKMSEVYIKSQEFTFTAGMETYMAKKRGKDPRPSGKKVGNSRGIIDSIGDFFKGLFDYGK